MRHPPWLRLCAILESHPGISRPYQLCTLPCRGLFFGRRFPKCNSAAVGWRAVVNGSTATSPKRNPTSWSTPAPSYPTHMAFRIMLRNGLRMSETLALRRVDLRLYQDPPIIVARADSPGNKARKGREVPVRSDLAESMHDLASFHNKDRQRPMLEMSRWRLSQVMKETALQVGINPKRAHPHAFRHTYGRNCVLRGVPIPVLRRLRN